jgi:uncharacterized protein YukE
MSFEGMDADELRGLAAQINTDAQTLSGLVATMTGVLAELTLFWQGPMVAVFEQDWQAKYRPSLLAAYDTLAGLHTHLVSNIDQQTSASAAEGGWTVGRVVNDLWQGTQTVGELTLIPLYLMDKEKELFGHGDPEPTGRGPWTWLEKQTEDKVFPYLEDTKPVRWLKDTRALRYADDLLVKTHAYKVLKFAGPAGIAVGVATVAVDLTQAGQAQAAGNTYSAANHTVDAAADAVMMFPVVGWLGHFDIEMTKADVDEVVTGGPIPSPFSWQNLKEDYFPLPGGMWQELKHDTGKLLGIGAGGDF